MFKSHNHMVQVANEVLTDSEKAIFNILMNKIVTEKTKQDNANQNILNQIQEEMMFASMLQHLLEDLEAMKEEYKTKQQEQSKSQEQPKQNASDMVIKFQNDMLSKGLCQEQIDDILNTCKKMNIPLENVQILAV